MSSLDDASGDPGRPWSSLHKFGFRILFAYCVLHVLPVMGLVAPVVARQVLGFEGLAESMTGSGDRTIDWIALGLDAIAASLVALAWSAVDRKREDYRFLARWLVVGCRYYLASVMFGYGLAKIFGGQFGPPSEYRLIESYGDSSPMGLLWTFMGHSPAYTFFTGVLELLGGTFLLSRRTTTLGACIVAGVMANVVMLNFCYDVPAKIFSSHLMLFGVGLLLVDARRFARLFLLNRPTQAADLDLRLRRRWVKRARLGLKTLIVLWFAAQAILQALFNPTPPASELHGLWEVQTFVMDGQTKPPLTTDEMRWEKLLMEHWNLAFVRTMDGEMRHHRFELDDDQLTVTWTEGENEEIERRAALTAVRADDRLTIVGVYDGHSIAASFERRDRSEFLLVERGFHWVQEHPHNR